MKSFIAVSTLSAASLALAQTTATGPTIVTPVAVTECEPTLLTLTGDNTPFFVNAIPAGEVSAEPLLQFQQVASAGNFTWEVNLPGGSNISFSVRDGLGNLAYSSPIVIKDGLNSTCAQTFGAVNTTATNTTMTPEPIGANSTVTTNSTTPMLIPAPFNSSVTIASPASVVQCQPVLLSWMNGVPPYYVSLIPAGELDAEAYYRFPSTNGTSYTWNVNLPAETELTVAVRDGSGRFGYTSPLTIQTSPDSSCVNVTVPASTAAATSAPAASSAPARRRLF